VAKITRGGVAMVGAAIGVTLATAACGLGALWFWSQRFRDFMEDWRAYRSGLPIPLGETYRNRRQITGEVVRVAQQRDGEVPQPDGSMAMRHVLTWFVRVNDKDIPFQGYVCAGHDPLSCDGTPEVGDTVRAHFVHSEFRGQEYWRPEKIVLMQRRMQAVP